MRVSLRWLTELVPALERDPEEVAEALTAVGLAVDGLVDCTTALRPVVIATVKAVVPHPAREKLQLVTVQIAPSTPTTPPAGSLPPRPGVPSAGSVSEITVVCGASNVPPPGAQVLFAPVGSKLPGVGFELTPKDIGGVESLGMLTSEFELGLSDSSAGIITLPAGSFPPGTRFIDAFPEGRDAIFELDVTPNRPDALGHVGVARDLAAYFGHDFTVPAATEVRETGAPSAMDIGVSLDDSERCGAYFAAVVRSVKVGPSPDFMRWRLHRLGVRPISNVVDVTNWLMLEFGQPMHAFDRARIGGGTIRVRGAKKGEVLSTLDGAKLELAPGELVIADASVPTALAGIMGGKDSEIGPETSDVVLECAYFDRRSVRRTARAHGLHTESSHRFERGTDPLVLERVIRRARALLAEHAGGQAAPGLVQVMGKLPEVPRIELRSRRIDSLLGVPVPFKEALRLLTRLGFEVEFARDSGGSGEAVVRGASHRPDVNIEHDLIEEVARIRGLDAIPTDLPVIPPQDPRTSGRFERRVATVSVELGLSEALTYSFVSEKDLERLGAPASVVRLENPLTEERSVLRTSLLPGLLEALGRARRRGERRVTLFSLGSTFQPVGSFHVESAARPRAVEDQGSLPVERAEWAALIAGPRPAHGELRAPDYDVYDAKGIAVELVERLTGQPADVSNVARELAPRHLHPRGAGVIRVAGQEVGRLGPLHPDVVEAFDLDGSALVVELDLSVLERVGTLSPRYRPIAKLPAISRDLSLLVDDRTPASDVARMIRTVAGELCESAEPAVEFRGGSVPPGRRSLTFRIVYRDPRAQTDPDRARTLTDKEVDEIQARVLSRAAEELGVTLR